MSAAYPYLPYCGAPPQPSTIWTRWNLDPLLLLGLTLMFLVCVALDWRGVARRTASRGSRSRFYAGLALTAVTLVCPLCPLSVSLFSARVGQHLILTTVAAPLIALGAPRLRAAMAKAPLLAAAVFAVALWTWHSPAPYTATFTSDLTYWLMHATTIGAAVMLWSAVLGAASRRPAVAIVATLATSLQMTLLGAVITFAPRALYAPHALTTWAWGMTPLQDQQLGGVLMWAPAGLIFALATVAPLARLMRGEAPPVGLAAWR